MPRKSILPRHHGTDRNPHPTVEVRWGRDSGDVQIGLQTPDEGGAGSGCRHLVDYWYGGSVEEIGAKVVEWAQQYARTPQPDLTTDEGKAIHCSAVGRSILDMVTGSSTNGDISWWTDLDRFGCNQLIKLTRTARDSAYGRDE